MNSYDSCPYCGSTELVREPTVESWRQGNVIHLVRWVLCTCETCRADWQVEPWRWGTE